MDCMKPVLKEIPEGDWYCHNCVNDSSDIVVPGQEPVISKKKAKMPSATQKKDWGRGKVPPVAGIAGKASTGAVSIVLAAGYPEDKDEGLEFTYTGAGGRNLKDGNKRVGQQTRDQVLEGVNEALARACDCPISLKGGVAKNWKNSHGIRVIRSVKLRKHNVEYAPLEGNRYDGIYKIVKYWPERGESGYDVWRYLMRRDDPEPAPWTEAGKKRIKALGLVMYDPDATPVIAKDRTYCIPERILKLMKADSANDRSWRAVQQKKYTTFAGSMSPVTSSCGHNTCQSCLSDAFKNMGKQCPTCRADLCKDSVKINKDLEAVFTELMSQGPAVDVETAEAPSSSKIEDSSNLIPSNVKSSKVGSSKVKPQKVKPSKENVPKVNPSKENVSKIISSKVNSSIVNSSKENIPQVVESLSIGTGKKRSAPSSTPNSKSSRKSARFTRTS
ncbi:E3 ubiquitin-protein ligase uhrf1 [Entomortierella lignicola]|nr:E3 ubiquitin-protein ligase uhrf1 [Entomortierella lignicola]